LNFFSFFQELSAKPELGAFEAGKCAARCHLHAEVKEMLMWT
jgi:hypothetical protein